MFKQRLKAWGIYKYRRAAEKHATTASQPSTRVVPDGSEPLLAAALLPSMGDGRPDTDGENDASAPDMTWTSCEQSANCTHRDCVQEFFKWPSRHITSTTDLSTCPQSSSPSVLNVPLTAGCVEEVLYYVRQFTESLTSLDLPPRRDSMCTEAAKIVAAIPGHCAHRASPDQCERCTWAEFDYGLEMLATGDIPSAFASFELGCRLARWLLSDPSKYFIRNLFMVFGRNRWESFESLRHRLLGYLAMMASVALGSAHPITKILENIACPGTLEESAEFALRTMLELFEKKLRPAHPDVLLLKRSLSIVLRRQGDYEVSERELQSAIHDSEVHNGVNHKETRRCLRRLAHLYMEVGRLPEAEMVCERILASAPTFISREGSQIPDEISVYTYHHLAEIANAMGNHVKCREWFSKELVAAIRRWGPSGDYSAECIRAALLESSHTPDALAEVVKHYPDILEQVQATAVQAPFIVSKARWCAIRNLV